MPVTVYIPTPLRPECGGAAELQVEAKSLADVLQQIEKDHPALYRSVCDETGAVRRHVNLFVNNSLFHQLDGLKTKIQPGDTVTIMPAVSGG